MKKLAAVLLAMGLSASVSLAATNGTDNAADPAYASGWTNGTNGGTGFLPWDLTGNNNDNMTNFAGYFIGPSTDGSGDIDTSGKAFGVYANPSTAFADADRSFDSALNVGQTFSLQIAVNFRNGNKGFNLEAASGQVFNFNVGGDDYSVNGVSLGVAYDASAVFTLSFTQTTLDAGTWTISLDGNPITVANATYTGDATGFVLYNSGTNGGSDGAADNLYFNNLSIVPEPSSLTLLAGPAILGAWFFARRRRSA